MNGFFAEEGIFSTVSKIPTRLKRLLHITLQYQLKSSTIDIDTNKKKSSPYLHNLDHRCQLPWSDALPPITNNKKHTDNK